MIKTVELIGTTEYLMQ